MWMKYYIEHLDPIIQVPSQRISKVIPPMSTYTTYVYLYHLCLLIPPMSTYLLQMVSIKSQIMFLVYLYTLHRQMQSILLVLFLKLHSLEPGRVWVPDWRCSGSSMELGVSIPV